MLGKKFTEDEIIEELKNNNLDTKITIESLLNRKKEEK